MAGKILWCCCELCHHHIVLLPPAYEPAWDGQRSITVPGVYSEGWRQHSLFASSSQISDSAFLSLRFIYRVYITQFHLQWAWVLHEGCGAKCNYIQGGKKRTFFFKLSHHYRAIKWWTCLKRTFLVFQHLFCETEVCLLFCRRCASSLFPRHPRCCVVMRPALSSVNVLLKSLSLENNNRLRQPAGRRAVVLLSRLVAVWMVSAHGPLHFFHW